VVLERDFWLHECADRTETLQEDVARIENLEELGVRAVAEAMEA